MKNLIKAAGVAVLALAPMQAGAVTGNIPFNGSVTHTCVITVGPAGTITSNAGFTNLSSTNTGGASGSASVAATGNGFRISVDQATLPTKPAADTSADTLASSYSTGGATSTSGVHTDAVGNLLNHGTTSVSVDMSASKSGSDVYETGTYAGQVVLRCE